MTANSNAETTPPRRRGMPLHTKILIGLVVGFSLGLVANAVAARPAVPGVADALDRDGNGVDDRVEWWAENIADPIGKVFLRLIFMVVIPLVFSALALGVAGMGNMRQLGRVGARTMGFTAGLSLSAVVLGIVLVNVIRPGHMLSPEQQADLKAQYQRKASETVAQATRAKPLKDTLLDIIPENPLQEMVGALDGSSKGNGMLAVMFFALIFGASITQVPQQTATLVGWLEGLNAVSMAIIGFAMRLAPVGVACLVFSTTARLGLALIPPLAGFTATVLLGLGLQLFVVYGVVLACFGGMAPWTFFRKTLEAMLTAFGTSSSNATLPTSLRVAEENLHLPRQVANFVLTIGATGNQNGTALFEGVVVLFLAQVLGVPLSLLQQITVVLMSVLAGIGTAGVPGGSIPLIVVVLQSVGVPGEGIALVLGIDRLLDMCRTVVNVAGDLVIAKCVAWGESLQGG